MIQIPRAPERGLFILRAVLGTIFLTHGIPKLMDGAAGTAGFFAQIGIPLPQASAWLVTLLEVFGGLALIVGAFVPIVASLFIVMMTVGLFLVHIPEGWFVVGPGTGGAEFNVLLIAGLLNLILAGSGEPNVDRRLVTFVEKREEEAETPAGVR